MGPVISRDPEAAQAERYDLIVIGGGIYGCALTLEAARAGLKPLLLERDDFGEHTSSAWLRILHGGLRSLQTLDLRRHRESVMERRWFLENFPDLVEPLRCVMPLYGDGLRRRSVLACALGLNDALSSWRNHGSRPDRRIPRGRTISASEVAGLISGIDRQGLQGAAIWYDALCPRPQRMLMEVLRWAVKRGARALNYVGATDLLLNGTEVRGARGLDSVSGKTLEFHAPVVVNCAGPWSGDFALRFHDQTVGLFRPSLALNLLIDRAPGFQGAMAVRARRKGARTYFLLDWSGKILAGTFHASQEEGAADEISEDRLVDAFMDELAEAAPWLGLSVDQIIRVYSGQLPVQRRGTVDLAVREVLVHHGASGGPIGFFSVSGVKYTMARRVAARTLRLMGGSGLLPRFAPGRDAAPVPRIPPDLSELEQMVSESPASARRIMETIVAEESVIKDEDLFLRRTNWGETAPPSAALRTLAQQVIPQRA